MRVLHPAERAALALRRHVVLVLSAIGFVLMWFVSRLGSTLAPEFAKIFPLVALQWPSQTVQWLSAVQAQALMGRLYLVSGLSLSFWTLCFANVWAVISINARNRVLQSKRLRRIGAASIWTSTLSGVLEIARLVAILLAARVNRHSLQLGLAGVALAITAVQLGSVVLGGLYNLFAYVFSTVTPRKRGVPLPTITPVDGSRHFAFDSSTWSMDEEGERDTARPARRAASDSGAGAGTDGGGGGMFDYDDDDGYSEDEMAEREVLEPPTPHRGGPSPSQRSFLQTLSPWAHPGARYRYLHRLPTTYIPGVGPIYQDKLATLDLQHVTDVLEHAATEQQRQYINEETGIPTQRLSHIYEAANMLRVRTLGRYFIGLLIHEGGVGSVADLAHADAGQLTRRLQAHPDNVHRPVSIKVRCDPAPAAGWKSEKKRAG